MTILSRRAAVASASGATPIYAPGITPDSLWRTQIDWGTATLAGGYVGFGTTSSNVFVDVNPIWQQDSGQPTAILWQNGLFSNPRDNHSVGGQITSVPSGGTIHVPTFLVDNSSGGTTPNDPGAWVALDGSYVEEGGPVTWVNDGYLYCGFYDYGFGHPSPGYPAGAVVGSQIPLPSRCTLGAHGASHLSVYGSAIRASEAAAGQILHVMGIEPSMWRFGLGTGTGFQSPAIAADSGYNTASSGNLYGAANNGSAPLDPLTGPGVIMGQLCAVDNADIAALVAACSTTLGKGIATAMNVYGAVILDNAAGWSLQGSLGASIAASYESFNLDAAYNASSYFTSPVMADVLAIIQKLRAVTNYAPLT